MADAQSRFSPKLIAGAVLILVLGGFAFSRYFGGNENTTPPSPVYDAIMADKASEGYRVPTRSPAGTPGAGASRLSGAEDSTDEEATEEQGVDPKKRKRRKKRPRRASEKDEPGIERSEDGNNRKKLPPMG